MQTRRVFLNCLVNSAIVAASGGLAILGEEKVEKAVKNYTQGDNTTNNTGGSPTMPINRVTNFALGGILGIAIKKLIEKSIELNRANKKLSSTISKLQELESNDLPGIKRILQEFVRNEEIKYEPSKESDLVKSIQGLLNAILIHISSQNKSVQPFLEELQKLRKAMTEPFTEQLQSGGDVDTATKAAVIQVLRSDKLTEYLETIIVNALKDTGAGDIIGKRTVDSITKKDLTSPEGDIALKEAITAVLKSPEFIKELTYATSVAVTEYGITGQLADALADKFKTSLQDNDTALAAFEIALSSALKSISVSETSKKAQY